jgi:serine/threonine protein kinase
LDLFLTDIWFLGVSIYQAVTHSLPFEGKDWFEYKRKARDPSVPIPEMKDAQDKEIP